MGADSIYTAAIYPSLRFKAHVLLGAGHIGSRIHSSFPDPTLGFVIAQYLPSSCLLPCFFFFFFFDKDHCSTLQLQKNLGHLPVGKFAICNISSISASERLESHDGRHFHTHAAEPWEG